MPTAIQFQARLVESSCAASLRARLNRASMIHRASMIPALKPATWAIHNPNLHVMHLQGDCLTARCSLWWSAVPDAPPSHEDAKIGLIGHYAAATDEAASALLRKALSVLWQRGCTLAVGPMDGATWRPYRFVVDYRGAEEESRCAEPSFFLEPDHPASYPYHFEAAGFAPVAHYRSALVADLEGSCQAGPFPDGVTVRTLDANRFEADLERLYPLVAQSFRGNLFYTPLPHSAFLRQYRALRPYLDVDLVLMAEAGGMLIGACFMVPDHRQADPSQAAPGPVDTAILKTLAVHPAWRGQGLGGALVRHAHQAARACGYRRVIHALMHEDNPSSRISARHGTTMRRYALYARELHPSST